MRCVQCGSYVTETYRQFTNGTVKLTNCPSCDAIADKYAHRCDFRLRETVSLSA